MGQSLEPGYDLIITNGDAAGELLRKAIANAEVMPWRDVLHDGPVPLTDDHEELSEIRADFLADRGWGEHDLLRENFRARDRGLAHNEIFEHVVLWFEHDLYDQLQLIQVLDWFRESPRGKDGLALVQADDFLGQQTPETIGRFAETQTPITTAQSDLAHKAWVAFRQPTPEDWAGLLKEDLSALPFLRQAVLRMLQELPDAATGVSRTEREILIAISDGVCEPRFLFGAVQRQEEAAFMGDWSFWERLDALARQPGALIEGLAGRFQPTMTAEEMKAFFESPLSLTELGRQVLAGAEDYAAHASIDRWFGGTHLTNDNLWRWDDRKSALLPPI